MNVLTLTQDTSRKRDYEFSEALHVVADLYYRGSLPEAKYPAQPILVSIVVASLDEVEMFARENSVEIGVHANEDGSILTTADLTIAPDAVTVRIIHISRTAK